MYNHFSLIIFIFCYILFIDVLVLRPSLPVDLLAENVGQSEDILISLFHCALNMENDRKISCNNGDLSNMNKTIFPKRGKVIIILDNLEYIVGSDLITGKHDKSSVRNFPYDDVIPRMRSCFFTFLDWMREQKPRKTPCSILEDENFGCNDIFIVATSTDAIQGVRDRFDSIFHLTLPNEQERKNIIESFFRLEKASSTAAEASSTSYKNQALELEYQELLSKLSKQMVGKSAAVVAKICRETLLTSSMCTPAVSRSPHPSDGEYGNIQTPLRDSLLCMQQMDKMLQVIPPESLLNGTLDVSITVESSIDLLGRSRDSATASKPPELSLFGLNAAKAWAELESLIIPPLCRPDELEHLLYGADSTNDSRIRARSRRMLCAGALLTGPPGCGLSTLARHCASVAASMVPSMKLLSVSCTSLIHKEVGRSERSVQQLFFAARHAAPCIIVLDGIETISRVRGNDNTSHGTMDRILSTLLTEMDGIDIIPTDCSSEDEPRDRIAVIGITHHATWIDPALRRPNRLDKCIGLDYPDVEARSCIAIRQLSHLPLDFSHASYFEPKCIEELSQWIAFHTAGMSATEVIALCTEAVMACLREAIYQSNDETATRAVAMGQELTVRLRHTHFVSALKFRTTGKI
jgi:SpoVK/Ycf46/Vps4 family AAA+-type ATPase